MLANLYPIIRAEVCVTTFSSFSRNPALLSSDPPSIVYPNSVTLFGFISRQFTEASEYHAFPDPFSAVTRNVNSSFVRNLVARYDRADLG